MLILFILNTLKSSELRIGRTTDRRRRGCWLVQEAGKPGERLYKEGIQLDLIPDILGRVRFQSTGL